MRFVRKNAIGNREATKTTTTTRPTPTTATATNRRKTSGDSKSKAKVTRTKTEPEQAHFYAQYILCMLITVSLLATELVIGDRLTSERETARAEKWVGMLVRRQCYIYSFFRFVRAFVRSVVRCDDEKYLSRRTGRRARRRASFASDFARVTII